MTQVIYTYIIECTVYNYIYYLLFCTVEGTIVRAGEETVTVPK